MVLMMATLGQKFIAFIAFALVARLTGPNITGTYFFAVSVTSVFVTLSDLGITPVIIRAIAGAKEDADRLFGAAIRAKLLLIPVAILSSLGYGILTGQSALIMATIAIASMAMAADAIHLILYGSLRGRQNLKPEAIGMFLGQVVTATIAITAAVMGWGPIGLAVALCAGSFWNVGWSWHNAKKLGVVILKPQAMHFSALAKQALPFAIAGISVKVYSYVDSLMLQAYQGATAVGYYAAAYKMTYAMQFLPLTFSAALYPALASAFSEYDEKKLKSEFNGALKLMAAIAFPIAAGLSALAPRFMPLLYGSKYMASIPAMEVLPWVLIPIFLDFPVGALMNGSHRAHLKTMVQVSTMVINVILNAILVPMYGPVGAAWAGVFSFWALFMMGTTFTYKTAGGAWEMAWILLRSMIGAAIAYVAWKYVGGIMPFAMAAVFGGAIAIASMFVLKLITVQDVLPVWRAVKQKVSGRQDELHEE